MKTSQHGNRQQGFTLIELVVVIVILGILAAFAVPRFMGMEGEARAATVKSFGGSLRAAASLARGKCQAQDCGANGVVTIEGRQVTMSNGYPNAATIVNTMDFATAGFANPVQQATNPASVRFTKNGGSATCWVQYAQAANANNPPVISYGSGGTFGTQPFNAALATACGS
jgi:MSHA pilin protein MshA